MISPLADTIMLGYKGHTSGANGTITRIVIHATVSPCEPGGARANARYFQSASSGGLAHYVVDPSEVIACCDEDISCWHAPPNAGSIGIELTDPQTVGLWGDPDHQAMLALAARLTADICARHRLPVVWRPPDQLRAGNSGITSHANVAQAWHKTDHTDPGPYFPVDQFIALVDGAAPTPAPEDNPMSEMVRFGDRPEVYVVNALGYRHVPNEHERDVLAYRGLVKRDPSWENGCVNHRPESDRAAVLIGKNFDA